MDSTAGPIPIVYPSCSGARARIRGTTSSSLTERLGLGGVDMMMKSIVRVYHLFNDRGTRKMHSFLRHGGICLFNIGGMRDKKLTPGNSKEVDASCHKIAQLQYEYFIVRFYR